MATDFKLFSVFLFMISLTAEASSQVSLSFDLIHRDSPLSPFYNPSHTHSDRLHNAFLRSISRARHFHRSKSLQSQQTTSVGGAFLMKISLGTPPKTIIAVADTGSDLIWTQCKPCQQCFNQTAPIFDPRKSSTYHDLSCNSTPCKAFGQTSCNTAKTCNYSYSYGDKSYTYGNLATETITMLSTRGRQVSLPRFVVGCGHKNGGKFDESESGVIGLTGNPFSLVSQLGDSHNISKQFSYCLSPNSNATSKIIFGSESVVAGPTTVSTPLNPQLIETFYMLTLEAISVGNKKIVYESSSKGGIPKKGMDIIIDSGTTVTSLSPEFYKKLERVWVKEMVGVERAKDPNGDLSNCYRAKSVKKVPVIKVHFTGAEVELKKDNIFLEVTEDVTCFAFVPDDMPIYGYLAQSNFLVGYDLVKKTVSFTPTECAKHK